MRRLPLLVLFAAAFTAVARPMASDTKDAPPERPRPPTSQDSDAKTTTKAEIAADPSAELPAIEAAGVPSDRLPLPKGAADLALKIDSHFAEHGSRRLYVQLDRPMYRPGETIWLKTWNVATAGLAAEGAGGEITYELLDPRGSVIATKRVAQLGASATNDFELPTEGPGGIWSVRATHPGGETDTRELVVASYSAPQIRKELDFVREAYGPGETVEALVTVSRAAGGELVNHPVEALLQVDGETVHRATLRTDATGAVLVRGALPKGLRSSDALLTVLVEDGGITESISRAVPVVVAELKLAFFPEGGDLVNGLPARVYFEGTNRHGEPADVKGEILDDRGVKVASFRSAHDGMGRAQFTPEKGRSYHAKITEPAGIADTYALPVAKDDGCVVRSVDDVHSAISDLRVGVRCSTHREVTVAGVLRERALDVAAVKAGPDAESLVYLRGDGDLDRQQGAVRVTVFSAALDPLAERLVYRNPGKDLRIDVTTDKVQYGPREEVVLTVKTTDASGKPLPAELALSVVDDAVLKLADDEEGHMLSRLYLDPELVEPPKDPAWYFDPEEEEAHAALDLVMGTKGWRRFDWQPVFAPPVQNTIVATTTMGRGMGIGAMPPMILRQPVAAMAPVADAPMAVPADLRAAMPAKEQAERELPARRDRQAVPADPAPMAEPMGGPVAAGWGGEMGGLAHPRAERRLLAEEAKAARWHGDHDELLALGYIGYVEPVAFAPVRTFPKPSYEQGFTGTRSDFRDTVLWEPTVRTDATGKAEVRFFLNDALTEFKVVAEGVGHGLAGHGEATLRSVLPVSLATKLPEEITAGDRLLLPVTVSSSRAEPLDVAVRSWSSSALFFSTDGASKATKLAATGKETVFLPFEAGMGQDIATLRLEAFGGGLTDTVERTLRVKAPGFPQSSAASGVLKGKAEHRFSVSGVVSESLKVRVAFHPSPVASLIEGMEGLIREPGGCFEQTSSTNWPNVAILNYLEAHDGDPRLRAKSGSALSRGYQLLTGYQIGAGGFETFGSGPGKEVLSAFGLLQFTDMSKVFPVDKQVIERDVAFLLAQRDGQGGYRSSGESAHGYGSAPKPVSDGFITYALIATGHGAGLKAEVAKQADVARSTKDPYVMALATRTLAETGHVGASAALDRLAGMQAADGSFPGAESSITRSYEANLLVESTALAALAMMDSPAHRGNVDRAVSWLQTHRNGGTWGATQATALALGALTEHATVSRAPRSDGRILVEVNGRPAGEIAYDANHAGPLELQGLEALFVDGENRVTLRQESGEELPYSVEVRYNAYTPKSEPGAELSLATALSSTRAKMGETVRLTARIENRTDAVVPSPIARIGIPAGLDAPLHQLKLLQERGDIAFFELRPREITVYWHGIHAGQSHVLNLDLPAAIPGTFTAPASSAYPYYDDDEKAWVEGVKIEIAS